MAPTVPRTNPAGTTLLLGVSTVIAQSILLREAMAAMGGSETAWGLVMALWLTGMGLGARLGVGFGTNRLTTSLPAIVLVLAGIGTLLFRAAPTIVGAAPGETLTTWVAVWLWAAAVMPSAVAGGLAFPVLAESMGTRGPGRAYTLEACGALGGGIVLTFALMHLGTAGALLVVAGLVAGAGLWPRRRTLAVAVAVGVSLLAGPAGDHLARATWNWSRHPGTLGFWAETSRQRLEISHGPPFSLYADGRLRATYPDPYLSFPRSHLMMLFHPDSRRVLAIGGIADGSVQAMTLHHPSELVLVEEDNRLPPILGQEYGAAFRSSLDKTPVRMCPDDPIRVIEQAHDLDLILLTDGDPTTLRANRTRTVEFFRKCRGSMAEDGVLVLDIGVSDTYLGGDGGRLVAMLANTLREVFPQITAVPGERVLLLATGAGTELDISLAALERRIRKRPDVGESFHPAHLELLLDQARQPLLTEFIETEKTDLNTIRHPRAVRLAARIHETRSPSLTADLVRTAESHGTTALPWILGIVVAALLGISFLRRSPLRATAAAGVVGFTSMGWWLLLLAAWQAGRGSVYAEVGALTAAFMAGVAVGGWAGLRIRRPERAVALLLGSGAVVSLVIAGGLPLRSTVIVVPGLLMLGGGLTGAAFPGLSALAGGGSTRRGAGIAFAADEIGAAAAALIIGTAAIPWLGMTATAIGLAILGAAGIPAALKR